MFARTLRFVVGEIDRILLDNVGAEYRVALVELKLSIQKVLRFW